jgi:hypothetical protein
MDPVTVGIMAASMAAKAASGLAKNKVAAQNQVADIGYQMDKMRQDAAVANARNKVLGDYLARQDEWVDQNQTDFNTGLGAFMPDAQGAQRTGMETARSDSILGAIGGPNTGGVALRTNAPNFVTNEIDKKVSEARDLARNSGLRMAKMGSYGDTWQQNNRGIADTAHKVDTTNTIAKGNMALVPYAQDLTEFQVRKPIPVPVQATNPWWTSALDGAANLGAAYAGSKFGGAVSTPAAAASGPAMNGGIWAGL